jgi:pathogenicity locus Cdd1 protein
MKSKILFTHRLHSNNITGKSISHLYNELCRATGKKHDPCLIDVFLSVVDFMNGGDAKPWWKHTANRKNHYESR